MSIKVIVNEGARCAKRVRRELERLCEDIKLEPTHPTVEKGYDEAYKDEHKFLDYFVSLKGARIAILDVSCPYYQLLDYNAPRYSKIMPVKLYKGDIIKQSTLPVFIMYHMRVEEEYGLPFKNRCVWIKGEDVIKASTEPPEGGPFPEFQANYYPVHQVWHRGLESLIKELNKLVRSE